MTASQDNKSPSYITAIDQVREVTLHGAGDLAYWRTHLEPQPLTAYNQEGRAQLMLSFSSLRWLGIPFREFTVSLAVCRERGGSTHDGFYLVHAFNSSSILAWMERQFFHTPYYLGRISLAHQPPAAVQVIDEAGGRLRAQMAAAHSPAEAEEEWWEGPVFLPGETPRRFFFARLGGKTAGYPFVAGEDEMAIRPSSEQKVFAWLAESAFTAKRWSIRADAHHAKSKTYEEE